MASYKIYDDSGRLISTVVNVLVPVQLTGLATNGTTSLITVDDTSSCFPGMPICAPYVPQGSFIAAIKSNTELLLACSKWNPSTGVFTTSYNNAITTTSDAGPMSGYAYGFSPMCLIQNFFPLGTWRNLVSSQFSYKIGGSRTSETAFTANAEVTGYSLVGTPVVATPTYGVKSDVVAATPLKRHNGEPWGYYPFVSTNGLLTCIPANPQYQIVLSSAA